MNVDLKRSGGRDPLTGVFNRKGGDEAVADYMKAHAGQKAMVLALDIDNFKLVNDVYGHSVGDEALKTLVRDMRETFGEESIITRNGGDEFILSAPTRTSAPLPEPWMILPRLPIPSWPGRGK